MSSRPWPSLPASLAGPARISGRTAVRISGTRSLLRKDDDLLAIKYFTARVRGAAADRQKTYLRALATLPLVTIHEGRFQEKRLKCGVDACTHVGDRRYPRYEEKRTDVNIAVTMLTDAFHDACDSFVIVSGDADLVPALNVVKAEFPAKKTIVYVPTRDLRRGAAVELRSAADIDRTLPLNLLQHAQFPSTIEDGLGGTIKKPIEW